jgi:tetratricopeptide (TPR) repeat protein
VELQVFSFEGAENLKKAITLTLSLRLQAQLFYKDQKEFIFHPGQGKPQDPHLYYFNEQNLKDLREIYRVLLPFHLAVSEFFETQNKETLNSCIFYSDPSFQGEVFEKNLQYLKAQEVYQQAVSLNPNDVNALLQLGLIEEKMGKSWDALPRYLICVSLCLNSRECGDSI